MYSLRGIKITFPILFAVTFFLVQALLPMPVSSKGIAMTFYVSPQGQDTWSGRLAAPNAARTDGPFAGMARAQQAVRALRTAEPATPVEVQIRAGTYFLTQPLTFTPADSGTAQAPVVYRAYPGEAPVLSGGVRISGWTVETVHGHPCWLAELPEVKAGAWSFTQLFVNGRRAPRPRLPREGYFRFAHVAKPGPDMAWSNTGPQQAEFVPGELRAWSNLRDVELVVLQYWVDKHMYLEQVDEMTHSVTFTAKGASMVDETGKFSRYYVTNVFEALDTPGQWYLDRTSGKLYYLPLPGETPETTEIIAPRLATLLQFTGSAKQPVSHFSLEGLAFSHSEWVYARTNPGDSQAAVSTPGAIQFTGAEHCALFRCTIAHLGQYAVEVGKRATGNRIIACTLHNLGAGGVKVDKGSDHTEVADCVIRDGGVVYHEAVGILIGDSGYNRIHHNEIAEMDYTGISCGWSWGYAATATIDNRIEYNHIHNLGRGVLSDMGGIYTLGVQPGGIIRGNVIHDIAKYSYGGWGIYNDEGSSDFLVENNLTYRTSTPGYNMHYGQDELIRNNIFAFAGEANIGRGRQEAHRSFVFEGNIVLWDGKQPMFSGYSNTFTWPHMSFAKNLYWNIAKDGVDFAGLSLPKWQALGNDLGSRIADPQFTNAQAGDFRLRLSSPALQMGFASFDSALAGPRRRTAGQLAGWPAYPEKAVPIVQSRLQVLPGGFTPAQRSGTVRLEVKNLGSAPATGAIHVMPELPGAARTEEDAVVPFTLAPGQTLQRDFTVELLSDAEEIALITVPSGDAVIPTCVYIWNRSGLPETL